MEKEDVIIAVEGDGASPKPTYKLYQNCEVKDSKQQLLGKVKLEGSGVSVLIIPSLFGTKMFLNPDVENIKMEKLSSKKAKLLIDPKMSKVTPILKPGNWEHYQHALYDILIGDENNPELFIAYSINLEDQFQILTKKDVEEYDINEIKLLSKENLSKVEVEQKISKDEVPDPIFFANGCDYSAEKLLDNEFLKMVQRELNATGLYVAIPRRMTFLACSGKADGKTLGVFSYLANKSYNEDIAHAPITNYFFMVVNGEIVQVKKFD